MGKYVLDSEWGTKYPNFKKAEFKCLCGKCNGYGDGIASSLVKTLQNLRDKYGAVKITSGYRCESHNKKVGGSANSKHMKGQAADFYIDGFNSQSKRVDMVNELKKTEYYNYSYTNVNGNHPGMGNVVHIDTKLVDPDSTDLLSLDEIAKEVIAGKWGNGDTRKQRLTEAGYNFSEVQTRVNEMLGYSSSSSNTKTYTVVSGDNLTKIAKKYNMTANELYNLNKSLIDNENKKRGVAISKKWLYPGQVLVIK